MDLPNVLMICIDDLKDWIGYLNGNPDVKTPHIDKLASEGRKFTNAHSVVPVCSPSRISIMYGLHATTHGSYVGIPYEAIERLKDVSTIEGYFQKNGYLSIGSGKILDHDFKGELAKNFDQVIDSAPKGGPRSKRKPR